MKHGSLFAGIGGFDLAAQWVGWENVFQVENDDYCNKVLKKNFPDVQRFKDIKQFDGTKFRGSVDIISGGFPCQPFSVAGKRKGKEDDRYLWPEMLRVTSEAQPGWIVAENVRGLINQGGGLVFEQVLSDMEGIGYETQPFVIPACAVNAPHRRDRVWIVAHSTKSGLSKPGLAGIREFQAQKGKGLDDRFEFNNSHASDTDSKRLAFRSRNKDRSGAIWKEGKAIAENNWEESWIKVATRLCRMDARIPNRVDRIKSIGNAIPPHVAFEIFKIIDQIENFPGHAGQ